MGHFRAKKGRKRNRPGLRAAIDLFCRSCIWDPNSELGSWRAQVEDCTAGDCPLYAVRPVARRKPAEQEGRDA